MYDGQRRAMRPQIPTEPTTTSPAETFQNQTLRPILKQQNELLLKLFGHYLLKRKQLGPDHRYAKSSEAERMAYIGHAVSTDLKFRNRLMGTVIGCFTTDELEQYLSAEAELGRRLGNLLSQRLQNQHRYFLVENSAAQNAPE